MTLASKISFYLPTEPERRLFLRVFFPDAVGLLNLDKPPLSSAVDIVEYARSRGSLPLLQATIREVFETNNRN